MEESFLHYIWQFQYFDKRALKTCEGDAITIFKTGLHNTDSGPDFSNARIQMLGIDWVGSIEIHTQSSFWLVHKHDRDAAYDNVVLHVVWENDRNIFRPDGSLLPTLELKGRVDEALIRQYRKLIADTSSIPCGKSLAQVPEVLTRSMLDKVLVERIQAKSVKIIENLRQHQGDWQQTIFAFFAQNFGFKVNSAPFFQLANAVPLRILLKHSDKLLQIEALLFGQAGFLEVAVGDDYYQLLRREYEVLQKKYSLQACKLRRSQWRFLRLRPANFPTLRLAQLASLVGGHQDLFSSLFRLEDYKALRMKLYCEPSSYWRVHYRFNKESPAGNAALGGSGVDNLLINSVIPLLVAYGKYTDSATVVERAMEWLQLVPAESNSIVGLWESLGVRPAHAFDSQAMIELYNNYCLKRKCLNCNIGVSLLKPAP